MAARRIGQYLPDWIKIATKVPEEARPQLNAIRTTYENIKTSLDVVAPKPEPINWDFYAKNVSKPGMVEAFRKAYEAVTVPYPKDVETQEINVREKKLQEDTVRVMKEVNEEIAKMEAQLVEIRNWKPFEQMSIDEFIDLHPELKKQIQEQEARNEWPERT